MLPKNHQQAWISGLPGLVKGGEIPFETLPVSSPKPEARSLGFTIFSSKELVSQLRSLSNSRTKIPGLSLVVRVDAAKELDNQYLMTGAMIDSVLPVKGLPNAWAVNTIFESISAKMGVNLNPGPPADCPGIQPTGVNTGWIFGISGEDIEGGKPIEIVDFTPPHYNRKLIVTLGKQSSEIQNLVKDPIPTQELVLVLPDRSNLRYIEFKLWDAKVRLLEGENHVAFESEMIECLTGEDK